MTDDRTAGAANYDAYQILGVNRDSDDAAISAAYHRLARRFHPDVAGDEGTTRMIRINAAFDRIKTPARRSEYDQELRRAAAAAVAPVPRPTPPTHPTAPTANPARPSDPRAPRPAPRDGTGAAGRPPGRPSGSVLKFGRHLGWSIGEIARVDPGYLVWLEDRPEGKPYVAEIDRTLRSVGYRTDPGADPKKR